MSSASLPPTGSWTFVTNHAAVLVCVARDPEIRIRDIATRVGITERAAQRIVADLANEGYLVRHANGRRNHYEVKSGRAMRHRLARHRDIGDLVALMLDGLDLEQLDAQQTEDP
jgi:DNA-binding IclR family transcriptional regulator